MACDISKLKPINKDTRAVVVGTGSSGMAAIRLLRVAGVQKIRVLDIDPSKMPEHAIKYLQKEHIPILDGEHRKEYFSGADIVIPSPVIPIRKIRALLSRVNPPDIIGETELALRFLQDEAILAITGTSGKTTTTSLCSAMLEEKGFSVFTGGNIGTPLSEYIIEREETGKKADIIVLELSSFQLQACHTLKPRVSLLLNLSENHLDHHYDMEEYTDAKMRIFRCQDVHDIAIMGRSEEHLVEEYHVQALVIYYEDNSSSFQNTHLLGQHNRLNIQAAYKAVKQFGVSLETAEKAVMKFQPIENRLEKIGEENGVLFVNDSKGTTIKSLEVALKAFDKPILLLAGGKFKGGDLEGLSSLIKKKVKAIALYGGSKEYFAKAWSSLVPMVYKPTLEEATKALYKVAKNGDVILLSPATSSYDQYKNYEERGKDFKRIFKALTEK